MMKYVESFSTKQIEMLKVGLNNLNKVKKNISNFLKFFLVHFIQVQNLCTKLCWTKILKIFKYCPKNIVFSTSVLKFCDE